MFSWKIKSNQTSLFNLCYELLLTTYSHNLVGNILNFKFWADAWKWLLTILRFTIFQMHLTGTRQLYVSLMLPCGAGENNYLQAGCLPVTYEISAFFWWAGSFNKYRDSWKFDPKYNTCILIMKVEFKQVQSFTLAKGGKTL